MRDHRSPDVFDMIADVVRAREAPWRLQAACRSASTTTFYPSQASGPGSSHPAKAICRGCGVRDECEGEWASMPGPMRNHGVWFGTVERDRRKLALAERTLAAEIAEAEAIAESLPSTCTDLLPSYTLFDVGTAAFGSGGEWVRPPHRFEPPTQETTDDGVLVRSGAPGTSG